MNDPLKRESNRVLTLKLSAGAAMLSHVPNWTSCTCFLRRHSERLTTCTACRRGRGTRCRRARRTSSTPTIPTTLSPSCPTGVKLHQSFILFLQISYDFKHECQNNRFLGVGNNYMKMNFLGFFVTILNYLVLKVHKHEVFHIGH